MSNLQPTKLTTCNILLSLVSVTKPSLSLNLGSKNILRLMSSLLNLTRTPKTHSLLLTICSRHGPNKSILTFLNLDQLRRQTTPCIFQLKTCQTMSIGLRKVLLPQSRTRVTVDHAGHLHQLLLWKELISSIKESFSNYPSSNS